MVPSSVLVKFESDPAKQAAAIIHQREERGDFKSIDELQKVPGIDVAKIDANKNRLSF